MTHPATATETSPGTLRDVMMGVALSGLGPVLVRESPVGPAATAFWRFILAAPIAFKLARAGTAMPLADVLWALLSGALLGADIVLWNRAIHLTSIMEASLLVMIYPFLVGLGGWVLFKDRVEPGVAVGAVIAFLGLGLLGVDSGGSPSGLLGNALALAAAFFYAGSLLGTARLCRRHDSTLVTAWSTLGAALTSLPFALIEGGFLPSDWQGWVYVLAYGVVTLGSYLLVARGLKRVPAAQAAIIGFGMPLIGTCLGFLMYGEVPGAFDMAGAALILCGIAWAVRPSNAAARA
jgi:drug/metabolite transporter (DMT)-like permease